MSEIMGAGAAVWDYDNDDDLDVFLVQGAPPQGGRETSKLFRADLDRSRGTLRFVDVTREAGIELVAQGMGSAVGDIDTDGDADLLVTTAQGAVLFRNDGSGRFTDVSASALPRDARWHSSAAFVDYDRDGDPDLFIAIYVDFTPGNNKVCREATGGRDYCSPSVYRSQPARLLRNDGGTFVDVTETAGVTRAFGAGLGVAVADYNGDTWPDIYVANDATPNQLWSNQRDGRFMDEGPISGTAYSAAGRPEGSMGIASGDYDRDGDNDLVVSNLVGETFVLYENHGDGIFEDRRAAVGLAALTPDLTGFGIDWLDADNDGWLDLFMVNGAVNVIPARRGTAQPFAQRNALLRSVPDGPRRRRFADVSAAAGPALAPLSVGRGLVAADFDQDGRIDVLITNNGGPARLLRNTSAGTGHWIALSPRHGAGHRQVLGTTVRVMGPVAGPGPSAAVQSGEAT